MTENIEVTDTGLKCDNPACDWIDKTITMEQLKDWINKPCPKCGENVLTEEDYMNAKVLLAAVDIVNSVPGDRLRSAISDEEVIFQLKHNSLFKNTKGLDGLKNEGEVLLTVDTHKGIRVSEIKNI